MYLFSMWAGAHTHRSGGNFLESVLAFHFVDEGSLLFLHSLEELAGKLLIHSPVSLPVSFYGY